MKLKDQTDTMLFALESREWFSNCGRRESADVMQVFTWKDALLQCSKAAYENTLNEARNLITDTVQRFSPERFNSWNKLHDAVSSRTNPLVKKKTATVIKSERLPQIFLDTVLWDIAMICMETEHADLYPNGYYRHWAHWYLEGHFPCGWEGEFPDGRLIVY